MNVLGLDLGTTTLSAVVVDGELGTVLETVNVPNGADLPPRAPYERIQDADAIAGRALEIVRALKEKYRIDAIGIDGQMHGILYVDADGRAASPLYTWQDRRGEERLGDTTYVGEISRLTGKPLATGYGLTTHYWHTVNDRVPGGAARLCTVCDYVGMRLAGRATPLLHVSSAASLGLFDAAKGEWDFPAMASAGMDARFLPEVTGAFDVVGHDPDGIPVACGIGDNQASYIGAVAHAEDTVLVNMGTGGQVSMPASRAAADTGLELRPLGEGRSLLVGSALCGGRSYALLEGFLRSCVGLAGVNGISLYEAMNRAGLEHLDDEDLLSVDTRFNGTRTDPALRGAITDIGTDNFDAPHLIAGVLMGMAREIFDMYRAMIEAGNAPMGRLVGSGNAIRRNPGLRRAFEKAFGMHMQIPLHTEEAAYGAALTGMAAAGLKTSLAQAQRMIRYMQD